MKLPDKYSSDVTKNISRAEYKVESHSRIMMDNQLEKLRLKLNTSVEMKMDFHEVFSEQ